MIITFFNLIFILYIIYCQNARGILHLFTVFGNTYRFSSFYQNKYTKYFTPVKTPNTHPFAHEVFIFKYANATQNPQFSHKPHHSHRSTHNPYIIHTPHSYFYFYQSKKYRFQNLLSNLRQPPDPFPVPDSI